MPESDQTIEILMSDLDPEVSKANRTGLMCQDDINETIIE